MKIVLGRIAKALVAGFGAGVGAGVAVIGSNGWSLDSTTLGQALGALIAAGLPVGYATWRVPNKPPAPSQEIKPLSTRAPRPY